MTIEVIGLHQELGDCRNKPLNAVRLPFQLLKHAEVAVETTWHSPAVSSPVRLY
jgi:hypothetical protein